MDSPLGTLANIQGSLMGDVLRIERYRDGKKRNIERCYTHTMCTIMCMIGGRKAEPISTGKQ